VGVVVHAAVKALTAGGLHRKDFSGVSEQVQVAIDGSTTDVVVLLADAKVYLVGGGVVAQLLHRLKHQLPLARVSSLHDCSCSPCVALAYTVMLPKQY
jgi:hypothetical protein